MQLREMQAAIDAWIRENGGYWDEMSLLARLTEEVGEVAREYNHHFGAKKKKASEGEAELAGVMAHEIAHVGDHMEHDVEGAQRFGAKAIWFSPSGETSEQADASISCLSKLPAALLELS